MRKRTRRRKVLGAAVVAAAGAALLRARSSRVRERVDVYFDDGSMVTLKPDASEAARLLPAARELLAAARG